MKEKILAALKTKFKDLGFSEKALESVADYLAAADKTDTELDPAISGAETLLRAFQSEVDGRVRSAVDKTKKELQPKPGDPPITPEPPKNGETPPWAKDLIDSNKKLSIELAQIKGESISKIRQQTLSEKLKDVPEVIKDPILKNFARMTFNSDDDFSTFVTETETYVKDATQKFNDNSLGGLPKPTIGGGGTSPAAKGVIEGWAKTKIAQQEALNKKTPV